MDEREDFVDQTRLRLESLNDDIEQPESPSSAGSEDRYEIEILLGEGSSGRVWKAYDRTLKRHVALKKVRLDGAGTRERILREARNQARVQNPNICKVFDLGEINGDPYIAMYCVEGRNLSLVSAEMTLREKVQVLKVIAEAVHAAHKCGLIHRDLKPGNILVEKTDRGWFPYVTDFGLAREEDAADRTKTGMIIGTPAYMAPEQAQGNIREIDPRTDVYALGATFYELLCGEPPFTGTSMEIAMKTIHEEPVSLRKRRADAPSDLEVIVMKCLEKEPERRYYSAQALADDLGRFLDGDPILARRASWPYRLGKKARRHRSVAVILVVALLGVLLSAFIGFRSWRTAAKRAEAAQQFGRDVAELEGFLRYASSLPIHDIRKEKLLAREKMKKIRSQMKVMGEPALVPGSYALGRGYLALREYQDSRTYLETAWNAGYRTPEIAYALGRVMGALYQGELEKLVQLSDEEARNLRRREIETQFRDPALSFLTSSRAGAAVSSDYLEAMLAFYSSRYEDAERLSLKAIEADPLVPETKKLWGDVCVFRGMQKVDSGDLKGAGEDFEKAGSGYKSAIEIARSDASIYEAECQRLLEVQSLADRQSLPTVEGYNMALAACDQAIRVDPESASVFSRKSRIYGEWASVLRLTQGDPAPLYEKAIEMARQAIHISPRFADGWINLGDSYVHLAFYQWDTGTEREHTLDLAIKAFQRAVELMPTDASYRYLGDAYSDHAVARTHKGLDPAASFHASTKAYEKAVQLNPRLFTNFSNLGMNLTRHGMHQLSHGQDPTKTLKAAIGNYEQAIRLNPTSMWAHNNKGLSYLTLAQYEILQARDPSAWMERAVQSLTKAVEINPTRGLPNLVITRVHCAWAEYLVREGRNPQNELEEARKAIHRFMEVSGGALGSNKDAATVELVAAEWEFLQGRSPESLLKKVESSLRAALDSNSEDAETYRRYARFYLLTAMVKVAHKKSIAGEIERGLAQVEASLRIDAQSGEAYALQAELLALAASQQDPPVRMNTIGSAKKALLRSFELNENLRGKYDSLMTELNQHDMEQ